MFSDCPSQPLSTNRGNAFLAWRTVLDSSEALLDILFLFFIEASSHIEKRTVFISFRLRKFFLIFPVSPRIMSGAVCAWEPAKISWISCSLFSELVNTTNSSFFQCLDSSKLQQLSITLVPTIDTRKGALLELLQSVRHVSGKHRVKGLFLPWPDLKAKFQPLYGKNVIK